MRVALLLFILSLTRAAAQEPPAIEKRLVSAAAADSNLVLIAAHRGGYQSDKEDDAPENTVANVEVAIAKGFDVYETDIQRTADGVFVVVHDATLDRETDGSGTAADLTLVQLKQLKKRYHDGSISDQTVATLEELLTAGKDRILFKPDLKPEVIDHFAELAALITRLGMTHQVLLRIPFKDSKIIEQIYQSGTPQVEVMWKISKKDQSASAIYQFHPLAIHIDVAKGEPLSSEKKAWITSLSKQGILVQTHSYGDPAQWQDLTEAGVRMFHTTLPGPTLEWLNANGWRE